MRQHLRGMRTTAAQVKVIGRGSCVGQTRGVLHRCSSGGHQVDSSHISPEDEEVGLPAHVSLMPANRKLEKVEQALLSQNKFVVLQDVLTTPLARLTSMFDYIFLDTAPNALAPAIAAYKAAEYFLLSAIPDPFAIAGLSGALADIEAARAHGNPRLSLLGVVLSMMDRRTNLAKTIRDYVQEKFALDGHESLKFATSIDRSTEVPKAQREGKTLFSIAPVHKVTDQYRQLAREVELRLQKFDGRWGEPHGQTREDRRPRF
jgi:chromosome partitioning protein